MCFVLREADRQGQKINIYMQLHFILQKVSLDPGEQHKSLWCSSDL